MIIDQKNKEDQNESKVSVTPVGETRQQVKRKNSLDDVVQRIVDLFHYVRFKRPLEPEVKEWGKEEGHLGRKNCLILILRDAK